MFNTLLAFIWKTPKWNVILANKERAIHRNANSSKAPILKKVPSTRPHCLPCVQGAWYLSCQVFCKICCMGVEKVRASLLSNNFAGKWWAHCTMLPLPDEGWGGMVEVGPSAPWSAPRKWEPRPCRAQRAGYRDTQKNLRNSVNLLHCLFHF